MVNSWSADRIGTALQALLGLSRPDPQLIDLHDLAFFSFSDHIVRVAGIESDQDPHDSDGMLFSELMELAIIQVNLLRAGVLVRGCTTVGEIVADTITGTWVGSSSDGTVISGTFRAEKGTR